ncbi:unnamed protein product, partial [Amoebophrya sp. A120]
AGRFAPVVRPRPCPGRLARLAPVLRQAPVLAPFYDRVCPCARRRIVLRHCGRRPLWSPAPACCAVFSAAACKVVTGPAGRSRTKVFQNDLHGM